jgi:hypothetical protein
MWKGDRPFVPYERRENLLSWRPHLQITRRDTESRPTTIRASHAHHHTDPAPTTLCLNSADVFYVPLLCTLAADSYIAAGLLATTIYNRKIFLRIIVPVGPLNSSIPFHPRISRRKTGSGSGNICTLEIKRTFTCLFQIEIIPHHPTLKEALS